jgi:DNA-binding response OmpR family regulator
MIVIVSSSPAERRALAALCESRGWASVECESVRSARRSFQQVRPRVVLMRHKLPDGYSDDIMAELNARHFPPSVKVIVLLGPGISSAQEARQIALGVDSVQRDPVRSEVLVEYVAKYRRGAPMRAAKAGSTLSKPFPFAGARLRPVERRLLRGQRFTRLTPREVQLAESLFESRGEVVTYATLYSEIIGGKFRGETSNMRVLLGKLDASFRSLGLNLRRFVEVIPKTGYRYTSPQTRRPPRNASAARAKVTSHGFT